MIRKTDIRAAVAHMRCLGYSGVMELVMSPEEAKESGLTHGKVLTINAGVNLGNQVAITTDDSLEPGDVALGALAH